MPGFQYFFMFLHHFVLTKLATSSLRVILDGYHTEVHVFLSDVPHLSCRCAVVGVVERRNSLMCIKYVSLVLRLS